MNETTQTAPAQSPPATAPENIPVSLRGFDDTAEAERFAHLIAYYLRELSRGIDLSDLDGVTIAHDYENALLELDRGFETSHKLTPSRSHAVGIAMTPQVLRDGKVKSHIVLNYPYVSPLGAESPDDLLADQAIHTLAHEAAHVEAASCFDRCFPGILLRQRCRDAWDAFRWQVILACYEEYTACRLSAPFGADPTSGIEDVFLQTLAKTKDDADKAVSDYFDHKDIDRVFAEVYGVHGTLLKFAAYHLGNRAGLGKDLNDLPDTAAALESSWFASHYHKLKSALDEIGNNHCVWETRDVFEVIGDLVDEMAMKSGIQPRLLSDGRLWIDVFEQPSV